MEEVQPQYVLRVINVLKQGNSESQYHAIVALRNLSANVQNKKLIREAGAIKELLGFLDKGEDNALTINAAETLSCLAADDNSNTDQIRRYGGIDKFVKLLAAGPNRECTHRALLALRILTIKEADRMSIYRAGGIDLLVKLLDSGPMSEYTEYAAAALGNVAAGSQQLKDAIREAGAIPPLVKLLRDDPEEISAELAAVVLRNLSLQNPTNREAIKAAGGLDPLLKLLSNDQDRMQKPHSCVAYYTDPQQNKSRISVQATCCFNATHGHLLVLPRSQKGLSLACFGSGGSAHKIADVNDKVSERYTLLRKLSITEPQNNTLELSFVSNDKEGAIKLQDAQAKDKKKCRQLEMIQIYPCNATDIKGTIMRLLTRIHLELEFGIKRTGTSLPTSTMALNTGAAPVVAGASE